MSQPTPTVPAFWKVSSHDPNTYERTDGLYVRWRPAAFMAPAGCEYGHRKRSMTEEEAKPVWQGYVPGPFDYEGLNRYGKHVVLSGLNTKAHDLMLFVNGHVPLGEHTKPDLARLRDLATQLLAAIEEMEKP